MLFLVVIDCNSTSQEPFINTYNKVTTKGDITLSSVMYDGISDMPFGYYYHDIKSINT